MATRNHNLSLSKSLSGAFTAAMGTWLLSGLGLSATAITSGGSQLLKHAPSYHFSLHIEESREDNEQPGLYHIRAIVHGHDHTLDENWRIYCPTRHMRKTDYSHFDVEGVLVEQGNAFNEGAFTPRDEVENALVDEVCS